MWNTFMRSGGFELLGGRLGTYFGLVILIKYKNLMVLLVAKLDTFEGQIIGFVEYVYADLVDSTYYGNLLGVLVGT